MSSKRRIRRKQCEGKQRFDTQQQALNAMFRMKRHTGERGHLNAYGCKFCGGFHYGHTPKKVRLAMVKT